MRYEVLGKFEPEMILTIAGIFNKIDIVSKELNLAFLILKNHTNLTRTEPKF